MSRLRSLGQIVILNGVPRSGKSSIVYAVQESFEGIWLNLGVDTFMQATPQRFRPGIGLRPGGERPDLEGVVSSLYAALFEATAACSRAGINVVVDVGIHDSYKSELKVIEDCAQRLEGLPALLVGVHCPLEVLLERRRKTGWTDESRVELWQGAVHKHGLYDLELDTSRSSPEECAEAIRTLLDSGEPAAALRKLAQRSP